jgi:hypothetical protein
VFQNWIERLKSVIRHNGEYFIKWLIKVPLVPSSSRNRRPLLFAPLSMTRRDFGLPDHILDR